MAKNAFIRARVDSELKGKTEKLFSRLGITMTEAVTMFLTQCELRNGLPFEVKIPNAETQQALDDAHAGVNMTSYATAEEMFREMDI